MCLSFCCWRFQPLSKRLYQLWHSGAKCMETASLWTVGRVDQSTVISSVEKRLINEPAQGAIDPTHLKLIFTLITLSTAWQFNTVGGKQLSSCPHLHQVRVCWCGTNCSVDCDVELADISQAYSCSWHGSVLNTVSEYKFSSILASQNKQETDLPKQRKWAGKIFI